VSLRAVLVSSNFGVCCWSFDSWRIAIPVLWNYRSHESHHGVLESCFIKPGCLMSFGTNHCLLPRYEFRIKANHPSVVLYNRRRQQWDVKPQSQRLCASRSLYIRRVNCHISLEWLPNLSASFWSSNLIFAPVYFRFGVSSQSPSSSSSSVTSTRVSNNSI
jgi:hypothetical protein